MTDAQLVGVLAAMLETWRPTSVPPKTTPDYGGSYSLHVSSLTRTVNVIIEGNDGALYEATLPLNHEAPVSLTDLILDVSAQHNNRGAWPKESSELSH